MKGIALGLGLAWATAGCIVQPSLHPLVTEAVELPEVAGCWLAADGDDVSLCLHPDGRGAYRMTLSEGGKTAPGELEIRFGRYGEETFWDATALPLAEEDGFWGEHRLAVHGFARIRLEDERLEIALLDPDAAEAAIAAAGLSHEVVAGDRLLTASSAELQRFFADQARNDALFPEPQQFARAPGAAPEAAGPGHNR